jgi:hypothetical protein
LPKDPDQRIGRCEKSRNTRGTTVLRHPYLGHRIENGKSTPPIPRSFENAKIRECMRHGRSFPLPRRERSKVRVKERVLRQPLKGEVVLGSSNKGIRKSGISSAGVCSTV